MSEDSKEASPPCLVSCEDATIGFRGKTLMTDVNLVAEQGDFLAIVGPNGSGKTTLLRTILGVQKPLAGRVFHEGRLGYAPQRQVLDPIYPFTSAEVVAMGLLEPRDEEEPEIDRADAQRRVFKALAACGMTEHAEHSFRDLSGGQKQRVLVARALVFDPEILILDEPTNDLDLRGEHEVMKVVSRLNDEGRTVVLVSHMLHVVARHARRIAFIHDQKVMSGSLDEMMSEERLKELYGMPVAVHKFGRGRMIAPGEES
ncbi:MAG: ABC-type Mn2+/Zn2+ transport system ATPase subunit [Planctomycetota bacterium]|jgi:ABC-type Mn2+/Zn2+ transport system ATPase subunit